MKMKCRPTRSLEFNNERAQLSVGRSSAPHPPPWHYHRLRLSRSFWGICVYRRCFTGPRKDLATLSTVPCVLVPATAWHSQLKWQKITLTVCRAPRAPHWQ